MSDFTGRVALVTGGGSGIGQATARAFAAARARVVVANRRREAGEETARLIREAGGEAIFIQTDVARGTDVAALVEQTVARYGRLDYAVNNAGTTGALAPTADLTESDFDEITGVNFKGVWLCMKYEITQMLRQGAGAIVNMSSVNGLTSAPGAPLYAATKYAVIGLTRSAAAEYAEAGIRVNAICAGAIRTPMLETGNKATLAELEATMAPAIPQKRIGDPEEIAAATLWLCSDAASYVTGHAMVVDGGLMASFGG